MLRTVLSSEFSDGAGRGDEVQVLWGLAAVVRTARLAGRRCPEQRRGGIRSPLNKTPLAAGAQQTVREAGRAAETSGRRRPQQSGKRLQPRGQRGTVNFQRQADSGANRVSFN